MQRKEAESLEVGLLLLTPPFSVTAPLDADARASASSLTRGPGSGGCMRAVTPRSLCAGLQEKPPWDLQRSVLMCQPPISEGDSQCIVFALFPFSLSRGLMESWNHFHGVKGRIPSAHEGGFYRELMLEV